MTLYGVVVYAVHCRYMNNSQYSCHAFHPPHSLPLLEQETDSGTVLAGNYRGGSNDECVVDISNLMEN